jgi:ABC-type nitrate/sulfonate/bicarbonate transport system ATPase subunit
MSTPAEPGPKAPDTPPTLLSVEDISQVFPAEGGKQNEVLRNISFTAERHETICILGPSGCGKSTILRVVSGMHQRYLKMPSRGVVKIRGREVTAPHDEVLTVFQRPVLKAWLDVRGNVALPFKSALWGERVPAQERAARVEQVLAAVGLQAAATLRPRQLSGGMQQRVALAARLVLRPSILCLDEPFSALDPQTRLEMQDLVLQIWKQFPCLALFVTHDVSEALRVGDRIIVLSTRPATIVMDLTFAEPKPRAEAWFRSPECLQIEQQIIARIREAASSHHGGTLNLGV